VDTWTILRWTLYATGGLGAIYALHRLGLWSEERGYIYYLNKKPRSGAAGSFVAFQQIIEPRMQHVIQVTRVNHLAGDEGASGKDDSENPSGERRAASDERI